MTYSRRQPWRPRGPWLGARTGARRRGFRHDHGALAAVLQDGVDVVVSIVGETGSGEDTVLAVAEPAVQRIVPARLDVSGLQAIAAMTPPRIGPVQEDPELPAVGWPAYGDQGDETGLLGRHSA